ncbi:Capsule biosynthesis protein CapC [Planctomycetes bacterium Pan216]|uniref:Capsule biosynthesis protein CapC n=1 Tax=Kolteria novifilia TaxID=2527975 RepID=A0A518AX69_9BACT|nr:Capsule biosynthesis protein CapC [Planctomycetes bacterium Pan216]
MIDMLALSIGVGLVVSLLFSELFGLAAGGMVVPGYFALFLTRPGDILLTILASVATYVIVHALSSTMIIYGRRRTVLMILFGYVIGILVSMIPTVSFSPPGEPAYEAIGFIIPGLIAIWIDRQGLVETLSTLLIAAVVVHLILIICLGPEFTG